jgi:hypothetical protein
MWKNAGRALSLRVFTLVFALQLRKKHGKTTVRVREKNLKKNIWAHKRKPNMESQNQ